MCSRQAVEVPAGAPERSGVRPLREGVRLAGGALERACGAPTWQLSDADVEAALAELGAVESSTVALRAVLLREAEIRSLREATRSPSTQRWLRDRFRWSPRQAAGLLRDAAALLGQPAVHAALAGGRLTPEQAAVVAAALDGLDRLEGLDDHDRSEAAGFLLEQAAALDPGGLALAGRAVLEALTRTPSVDDPADAAAVDREVTAAEQAVCRARASSLTVRRLPDGSVRARFALGPLDAAALYAWLRQADQPHPGGDGFTDDRPRDQRRGDHLAATLRASLATGPAHTGPAHTGPEHAGPAGQPPADQPAAGQHLADVRPVDVRVTVITTLEALRAGLADAGLLDTGGTVSAAEARRLACAAGVVPAVLGGPSEVLDLGRARRDFSVAQRRALVVRDRGCIAPGCERPPAACDAHHQHAWADGGPTSTDNGALLCEFHHQQVHRQGWTVALAPNGFPQLVPPVSIDPQQRPRQHHRYRLRVLPRRTTPRRT